MNKIRFGVLEASCLLWFIGIVPLIIILLTNPPAIVMICVIASVFFTLMAVSILPYLITKYHLRPAIDKCQKDETTWCRVTKDRLVIPQFVDKGPYGQTKGVTYKAKADVIDDGNFPLHWLNGNPCILMYDLMNTSIDLNKSVARGIMRKKYGIRSGIEGYKRAEKEGRVLVDE